MIYEQEPENFINKHEIVSCFCECDGEILFLLRADHKTEPNKWGPPAGKVNENETILAAIKREVMEETGQELGLKNFAHQKKLFVRYPDYDFVYHVFKIELTKKPKIKISSEHKKYIWVDPKVPKKLDYVLGQDIVNKLFYKFN